MAFDDSDYDDWKKHQDRGQFERERYERTGVTDWGDGGGDRTRRTRTLRRTNPPDIAGLPDWLLVRDEVWHLSLASIVCKWGSTYEDDWSGKAFVELLPRDGSYGKSSYVNEGYVNGDKLTLAKMGARVVCQLLLGSAALSEQEMAAVRSCLGIRAPTAQDQWMAETFASMFKP